MFRKPKREKGWMAVATAPGALRVTRVAREPGAMPRVVLATAFAAAGDASGALHEAARELHLNRYACVALLGLDDYQMLMVDAPNVPRAELRTAVRWRIKDMLDYPVDEATVDVLEIPAEVAGKAPSVFAVAARNDLVRSVVTRFEEADAGLEVIDIPEMAQRNLAALMEGERGLAMLAFDEKGGLLTITRGGELYFTRHLDVPLSRLEMADAEQRGVQFERIALELQRSLDHFDRQHHSVPLEKLVVAPLPLDIPLAEYLAQNLYVQVEAMRLERVLDCSAAPQLADPRQQCAFFLALGAALRDEAGIEGRA